MKYVRGIEIAWGVVYFGIGLVSGFKLNGVNFGISVTLLMAMFLLPLPIAIVSLWFPRVSSVALLLCPLASFVAAFEYVAASTWMSNGDAIQALAAVAVCHTPHVVFGIVLRKLS